MITKENISYSLRNLVMRKSRSMLTILSIFIGIATIFIFVSFGLGLYDYINEFTTGGTSDKFLVYGKGSGAPGFSDIKITQDGLDAVEKTRGVIEVMGYNVDVVEVEQGSTRRFVFASGAEPKDLELLMQSFNIGIEKGRNIGPGDTTKVALGYNYQFDNKILPKALDINDKIIINDIKFKVVGFYEAIGNPADDSNIYFTMEGYEKIFGESDDFAVLIGRADIRDLDGTVERVEKALRKSRDEEKGKEEFYVSSYADELEAFAATLNIVIGFIVLIALISVLVSAVNTANTMVTSVLERVREIGVIKSIGARNSEIFNIFLFESSFLGFVAGVIGVTVGWLFSATVGVVLDAAGWSFLSPHFSPAIFIGGILFATVVGAISGVAPAINASKKRPVDALRYE